MKTSMHNPLVSLPLGVALLALALQFSATLSPASVVISYGPSDSYVASDTSFNRTAGSTGSGPYIFRRSFSTATNDQLSPSTGYSGPTFYGGYQFISSTINSGFSRQQIRNNFGSPAVDQIYLQSFRSEGWAGSTLSLAGVYLFQQEDFISGLSTGSVNITSMSVSYSGFINTTDSSTDFAGRYVVRIAGVYYVTQSTFNLALNSGSNTLDSTALQSELWAVYTPSTNLNFDQASAVFSSLDLTGITGVGIYFENDGWSGSSASSTPYGFGIRSFEVQGIPEPSSLALFGLAALFFANRLRSRKE